MSWRDIPSDEMKRRRIAQAIKDGERDDRVANRKRSPTGELDDAGNPLLRDANLNAVPSKRRSRPVRIKGG